MLLGPKYLIFASLAAWAISISIFWPAWPISLPPAEMIIAAGPRPDRIVPALEELPGWGWL